MWCINVLSLIKCTLGTEIAILYPTHENQGADWPSYMVETATSANNRSTLATGRRMRCLSKGRKRYPQLQAFASIEDTSYPQKEKNTARLFGDCIILNTIKTEFIYTQSSVTLSETKKVHSRNFQRLFCQMLRKVFQLCFTGELNYG